MTIRTEQRKASDQAYRLTHREERKAYNRVYRQAHPEENKAYQLAYRLAHQEEMKASDQAYRQAYPEENAARNRRRRALKRGLEHQPYKLAEIIQRDRGICGICHKRVAQGDRSIDHILPLSLGGADAPHNVQLAHRQCNNRKQNTARFPANLRLALD